MDLKKAQATKGGVIHIAYLKSNMSLCLQYVGEDVQNIQDKNIIDLNIKIKYVDIWLVKCYTY